MTREHHRMGGQKNVLYGEGMYYSNKAQLLEQLTQQQKGEDANTKW